MNYWRINVYKDRSGNWRWRLLAPNGRKIGASTESYKKRKMAILNLSVVTGVQIVNPPRIGGGFWRRVQHLDLSARHYL